MFCRQAVAGLRRHYNGEPPRRLLFVAGADADATRAFFAERWPAARAVADPEQALYAGFSLGRGTWRQLLGPRVWLEGFRAWREGHGVSRPRTDPALMSGAFVVRGDALLWKHRYAHAGDHPDFAAVLARVRSLT